MKLIRLLGATLLVVAAGAPQAALVYTMTVDTREDQNGTDLAHCSLREAVKAVSTRSPFGGCPAGSAYGSNLIQLEPGEYRLTLGEIRAGAEVTIAGADSQKEAREDIKDPLTGDAPRVARPDYEDQSSAIGKTGTYIYASPGSRIFDMLAGAAITNVVLEGSASAAQASPASVIGNGGVVIASASLELNNVIIRGGSVAGTTAAAGNGGAVFLGGDGNNLTLLDVTIESSYAENKGGAVAVLCSHDLSTRSAHYLSVTRSLFIDNSSTNGAGAIDLCGASDLDMTSSTLSRNTSAPSAGAITYVQGAEVAVGKVSLSYVTAAEQVGHVLAVNGLSDVILKGSLLSGFNTAGATSICFNPDLAIEAMANTEPDGHHNAIDSDGSCSQYLAASGNNVSIAVGTDINQVLMPIRTSTPYYPTTLTGKPFGLTDYYLPKLGASSPLIDKGEAFAECSRPDQRNVPRSHGARCDIGAVERLQVTARDDTADSLRDTNRLAVVDILENDNVGESDSDGPYGFAADTPVVIVDSASGKCTWSPASAEVNPNRLIVDTSGALTPENAPISCTYNVVDANPDTAANTSATPAVVKVRIVNATPNAANDLYVRPVGVPVVVFDPLDNDDDKGDGIYGVRTVTDPVTSAVTTGPDWALFNPIRITSDPQLGDITGASNGYCPGSTTELCVTPPLTYTARNSMSPFTDSFTYVVYDQDNATSNAATVTIATDAQDPDHGGGAGSVDLLAGLILSLLGLRRFRRL